MSKLFPSDKDHIIDELDDRYELHLTDEETERLRRLTAQQLFFVTELMSRARKSFKKPDEE